MIKWVKIYTGHGRVPGKHKYSLLFLICWIFLFFVQKLSPPRLPGRYLVLFFSVSAALKTQKEVESVFIKLLNQTLPTRLTDSLFFLPMPHPFLPPISSVLSHPLSSTAFSLHLHPSSAPPNPPPPVFTWLLPIIQSLPSWTLFINLFIKHFQLSACWVSIILFSCPALCGWMDSSVHACSVISDSLWPHGL